MKPLSGIEINKLPLHDAGIIFLLVEESGNGTVSIKIRLEINKEESLEPFANLGIRGKVLDFILDSCWLVNYKGVGYTYGQDGIQDWRVLNESPFLNELKKIGNGDKGKFLHHHIELHSGSCLDVLVASITIESID